MAGIRIENLAKTYYIKDRKITALSDINLEVDDNSFVTVVGRSGSGKTTLLRILCGLEEKSQGQIYYTKGEDIISKPKISMVFQEPRLMPWLTVEENIGFSLINENPKVKKRKVDLHLELLGLKAFKDAYPNQISGGMAQRVALGRTLCYDPEIILMDEPLGALDAFTRQNLQREIVNLFANRQKTVIFVTHDVDEAILLGQKVVILEKGSVKKQIPIDLPYPRSPESERFFKYRQEILRTIMGN
ncbi:MAG: ABC transporter ATP-binding protein [Thermoanaerobacteraceae bacterium]|uniref:ABC transporter ATP-binding protein n=1 Tax=Tepidanaerobacter sp. GT38 TaxID=2722793 RepID=UPI00184B44CB|nr:ABC transporter ATP-binding protein [Tepidanaerobacter sp. GT38]MCG1012226.1 ABC transporter ATP-binding protein [Tepidanaerobacter sp. GT38]NLZ53465.1 ABC transporter ATP-binding protein [Thermoanaerobacteraceae bacterium]